MDSSSQPQAASLSASPAMSASSSAATPASSNASALPWPQLTDGGHASSTTTRFHSFTDGTISSVCDSEFVGNFFTNDIPDGNPDIIYVAPGHCGGLKNIYKERTNFWHLIL